MGIIIAILIFGLIVIFHELGHFLLAKKNGIRVDEFAIGMGPKLCGFKRGETTYAIRLLPFGGACIMAGEDDEAADDRCFNAKSVWARMSVVLAGPIFNFIMAFVCAMILLFNTGITGNEVYKVTEGSPAETAGLQVGDQITAIDGKTVHMLKEMRTEIMLSKKNDYELTYKRDGQTYTTMVNFENNSDGQQLMGVSVHPEKPSVGQLFQYSAYEVSYNIKLVVKSLGMLVTGQLTGDDIAGPVGMVTVIDDTYHEASNYGLSSVVLTMLNLVIILSANLGVMNLIPIPALDGGRFLFLIIEAIRRKPVDRKKEGFVNMIGFVLLMALMVFVLFNDVTKILF